MSNLLSAPPDFKPKGFWERPEGTTAWILIALIGAALFFGWAAILPWVAWVLAETIRVVLMAGFLVGLYLLLTSKKWGTLIKYILMSITRKITSIFVAIDPIGIMKSYLEESEERHEELVQLRAQLAGFLKKVAAMVAKTAAEKDRHITQGNVLRKRGEELEAGIEATQAARLSQVLERQKMSETNLNRSVEMADKMIRASSLVIKDLGYQVKAREIEFETARIESTFASKVRQIMQGGDESFELYQAADEYALQDIAHRKGLVETFYNECAGRLRELDLNEAVLSEQGLRLLDEIATKSEAVLSGENERKLLSPASTTNMVGLAERQPDVITVSHRGKAADGSDYFA